MPQIEIVRYRDCELSALQEYIPHVVKRVDFVANEVGTYIGLTNTIASYGGNLNETRRLIHGEWLEDKSDHAARYIIMLLHQHESELIGTIKVEPLNVRRLQTYLYADTHANGAPFETHSYVMGAWDDRASDPTAQYLGMATKRLASVFADEGNRGRYTLGLLPAYSPHELHEVMKQGASSVDVGRYAVRASGTTVDLWPVDVESILYANVTESGENGLAEIRLRTQLLGDLSPPE